MAATAYAAVVSLLNTLDQIQIHPFLSTYFSNNYSIDSLRGKVDFFAEFLEEYSDPESEDAEDLLRRIADAAHDAEEIINGEAANRMNRTGSGSFKADLPAASLCIDGSLTRELKKITREMDCIKRKATKAGEEDFGFRNPHSLLPPAAAATNLVKRMAVSALEAEDVSEFRGANQIRSGSTEKSRRKSRALQREKKAMDSNKESDIEVEEKTGFLPSPSASASAANSKTATMVGFDGYLEQLLDQLTGHHSGRRILSIVGMGGIGKTTLATNVYQNSLIVEHFHVRAWVTVSQEFSARKIYSQALSCLRVSTSNIDVSKSDSQLGEELYKMLSGRRYLIVLDDIWSVEAWEKIKFFFPENNNRSRIVVTTRESELVDYFGSSTLAVDFLDEKSSWEILCEKVFAKQGCPPELEEIGKVIVEKCKGLPLTITVFGGLLRKSPRTREYWEIIAKDKGLILDSGEGNIKPLSILYLSYKHLPIWLKPCFLYLGLFPEDHKIEVSQLIKLWVAEGFIRSKKEQSLEEIADSYINELVDRNLLLVGELRINKKLKSCRVHDVVRELCIRLGEKEKYFCVQRDMDGMCHFIVDEATAKLFYPRESQERLPSIVRPLIILEGKRETLFKSRLSRVSFVPEMSHIRSSSQRVNLRFLLCDGYALQFVHKLHSSMSLFWSLQTLIVDSINYSFDAPCEIWKMPQLRHIEIFGSITLPDPPIPVFEDNIIVLQNLQTLRHVKNFVLTEEVCKRIPNIKELEISYDFNEPGEASSCYHLHNLGCFNKLELLDLCFNVPDNSPEKLKLPVLLSSLKELSLYGCNLEWSDVGMIESWPHLQILKLGSDAVVGPEWDCVEREFLHLKHLILDCCDDLISWSNADSSSFPVLETLTLCNLIKLEEIPPGIGEIPTLERMGVTFCSESASMSAIKILEEQESIGNQSLELILNFMYEEEAIMCREKIQQLDIMSQNLHIDSLC